MSMYCVMCNMRATVGATPMADDMTIRDVHAVLLQAIRDLEAMGIEVPPALYLAVLLLRDDDRSQP